LLVGGIGHSVSAISTVVRETQMVRVALVVAILGLALPGAAHAYGWPVKPFDRMHPVRGTFDDPRFHLAPNFTTAQSFHSGVDISAPDDTPVYAVGPGSQSGGSTR
jgi:murein DD-endopeptidase MepM/ murein hydrolase activator NlpD